MPHAEAAGVLQLARLNGSPAQGLIGSISQGPNAQVAASWPHRSVDSFMIDVGSRFPAFSLKDQDGAAVTQEDLKGAKTIVYFYPKDDTPGCTVEACSFRDNLPRFTGARVFGVSPDDVKSHKKFVDKFKLNFRLLADVDHSLCEACGVWVQKSLYGKSYMGVERTTFLVGPDGVVEKVWRKVKPEVHAAEVAAGITTAPTDA